MGGKKMHKFIAHETAYRLNVPLNMIELGENPTTEDFPFYHNTKISHP